MCGGCTRSWQYGTEILLRGELVKIELSVNSESGLIRLGGELIKVVLPAADLRPAIERHLWTLAAKELPPRVFEYAALHQLLVRRVTVRNQQSARTSMTLPPYSGASCTT